MRSLPVSLVVFCFFITTILSIGEISTGAGSRESLIEQESIKRLTIGADFLRIKREIKFNDNDEYIERADSYSAFMGYDVLNWLNVFLSAGNIMLKENETDILDGNGKKWSLGLNSRLWQMNIVDPAFMSGQCSIEIIADYSQYEINDDGDLLKVNENFAALLFGYEIFSEDIVSIEDFPYSLRLIAGPAFSDWDGKLRIYGNTSKFKEKTQEGVVAGTDIYLSHNLSLGCHLHYFGKSTVNATLRFHF